MKYRTLSTRATNCLLNAAIGIDVSSKRQLRLALIRGDLRVKRVRKMGKVVWAELVASAGLPIDFDRCKHCRQILPKFRKKDKP